MSTIRITFKDTAKGVLYVARDSRTDEVLGTFRSYACAKSYAERFGD